MIVLRLPQRKPNTFFQKTWIHYERCMKNTAPFFSQFSYLFVAKIVCVSVNFITRVGMMNYFMWTKETITNVAKKSSRNIFFSLSFSHGKLIYLVHINANALCFDVTFLRLQSTLNSFICLCKCCTVSNSGINLTRKVLYFSFSVDWSKWMR